MKFAKFLHDKMHIIDLERGHRISYSEFADYLEVSQQDLSNWINNKNQPAPERITKLARKLGPEVYDALEHERPDPIYDFLSTYWEEFDPQFKNQIHDQAQQYLLKKGHKNDER